MSDMEREYPTRTEVVEVAKVPAWLTAVAIAGLVLALGALGWAFGLHNHLTAAENKLAQADTRSQSLADQLQETNDRLRAQGQTLGQSVGLTQKQLEDKSQQLMAAQRSAAASTAVLAKEQKETTQQVAAVKTDVSGVKTDVGGVKTDVASTQADLAATKTQMSSMMGDEGRMSGLIATNHDELEQLKHKGDRNYYEFTLSKGEQPKLVGTIKLGLKKVDVKKSKFTLNVSSDDRNIEKKDKNLNEPIQFYSGKSPMLYEIVVNTLNKNQVVGYLSTPKGAPSPMAMP